MIKILSLFKYIYSKFNIVIVFCSIVLLLLFMIFYQFKVISTKNTQISNLSTNVEAYQNNATKSNKLNITYQLTIDQLQTSVDSIDHKLDSVRNKLKIKDKQLQNASYIANNTTDTIEIPVPVEKIKLDTFCITFSKQPLTKIVVCRNDSVIRCSPYISNEQYIFAENKKQYVRTYKSFVKRLFKFDFKKHIISIITVTNSNPDVSVNKSKFINIIE